MGIKALGVLLIAWAAAQDADKPKCECKPREVGESGSRKEWAGYRRGIEWHLSVDEAARIAEGEKKLVFWFHLAGDLDKEGC